MDLTELTEEMRKRAGQNVKLGYKVKFILEEEDGIIFWDGTEHPPAIDNEDRPDATTTIRISAENLQKLMAGGLDPTLAYMTGKLKVEGSMGVALKLTSMFSD
ncbi:SCP2 sterol-binding domain-containing protein [Dongia deserti]|uniref:SCP2 sterol-binding domain-containing protein n=1 Tax=Dongia deserti TaxID=2268030 RepID=UPI000E6522A2|nr:SCP2 sterol-binding domain-containing protein [Dongia deserti]